jgi:hypothetical protein
LAQQVDASPSALCEACRAQRDAERAWGAELLGERDLLVREHSGLGLRAERGLREGRVGAPGRSRRTRASQTDEELAGGEEIVKRRGRPKLGQAKPAAGSEQPRSVTSKRGSPLAHRGSTMAASRPFRRWSVQMGKIVRRVLDGYITLIEWSPSDPATVEAAEMIFRREVEGGFMAVVEDDGVQSSEPVRSLPVDAERVVMTMPMGGG